MSSRDDDHRRSCGADVAAYALGALEPAEADAFRRHLESCSVCAHELASFRQVVDELPLSAPRYPAPPELRRRVLAAAAREPRLDRSPRSSGRDRRARWAPISLPRFRDRAIVVVGAVAALIAVAVVTLVLTSGSRSSERIITAHVTGPGRATLRVAHDHGELIVHGLAAPPRGKIYEVWLQRGRRALPTSALFGVTANGNGDVAVPGDLSGVSRVMVTPEPLGGSRVPTHAPVIVATL
jgi:anti-sigma-K factor RskA